MQLFFDYAVLPQKNSGFFSTTGCLFPTRKNAKIFLTQLLPAWELLLNSLFTPISEQWSQIIPPLPLITQTIPLGYPDHSPWLLRPFPLITQTVPLDYSDRYDLTQPPIQQGPPCWDTDRPLSTIGSGPLSGTHKSLSMICFVYYKYVWYPNGWALSLTLFKQIYF